MWDVREGMEREMDGAQALRRVRMQAQLLRRLNEQLKGYAADGVRSPQMDGMPRGRGAAGSGIELRYEKREAMQRLLARESAVLREYDRAARAVMERMRPEYYAFCALYYLAGLTMEETAEAIERSTRQCERYRAQIERGGKMSENVGLQDGERV